MAGSFSDYLELKILDHVYGNTAYSAPATLYYALFSVAPTDAGGGTEISAGGYARKSITNNTTNFPNASAGSKALAVEQIMANASADWPEAVAYGIFDALTSGNMLSWATLDTPRTILNGDAFRIPATTGVVITLT